MYSIESFKKKVNMLHIELSDKQYNQYVTYYEMVVEKMWNDTIIFVYH